ncbi:MAG: UDP-N-acetylmuramate--L-alanine ligase [Anaerolineales bacterium]|nr:UDP-N-acetylmuramate--L-alanine ligase [Anaerolineales bacterium]
MRRRVHLVGIGGAGLSAIARILHERGEVVTGSDQVKSKFAEALEGIGIPIIYGHRAENVVDADLIVASSAVPQGNVELQTAKDIGIPVVRRPAFLSELTADHSVIAVAGTHGKSTTTGLIAWLLHRAEYDPTFIVGGNLPNFETNAKAGAGTYFVIEADEYDRTFLGLQPSVAVVTNVEHDHPDCYPTFDQFEAAFIDFSKLVKELLVVCADDPGASSLSPKGIARTTYGLVADADWRAEDIRPNPAGGSDFLVYQRSEMLGLARTRLPGKHNVLNALAALVVGDHLGLDFKSMREGLTDFLGVGRRFEIVGEVGGVTVVDDYAHHPTEIKATLQAARERFPDGDLWAVFQPHTFSRIRALLDEFAQSFEEADHVIVTEVFASREDPDPMIDGGKIAERIDHPDVTFIAMLSDAAEHLAEKVDTGSVVITLSAGDGNKVGSLLLQDLAAEKGERRHD